MLKMKMDNFPPFKSSPDDSDCIYHYTKIQGATGILSEKKLWMINIRHLNDWMEGRYFYEPLLNMIGEESEHISKLKEIYEKCLKNSYIASFSEIPDLLSQYKYYGNICIAFDILGLDDSRRELNDNPTSGFEPSLRVDYRSTEEYTNAVSEFANDDELIEGVLNKDIYSLLKFFCFIGQLKHPGFSEECERRLFHFWYDPKEVKYRFACGRCVPYIEFNLLPTTITKIIVGPDRMQKEIAIDLRDFIESKEEFRHVDVCCSEIPFIPHQGQKMPNNCIQQMARTLAALKRHVHWRHC